MGKYVIKLDIEKESDLYCPYNSDHELSSDIGEYYLSKVKERGIKDSIVIRISSLEPLDEERVRNSIGNWLRSADNEYKREARENRIRQIAYFAVGLVFIVISLVLDNYMKTLMFTIFSTIGSLAISESALIWLEENPKIALVRKLAEKWLKSLDIEFVLKDSESE